MTDDLRGDGSRRPRVVVTGAAGSIGRAISSPLSQRWDLVATDTRRASGVAQLDVTDGSACREVFGGADAVVHLAANPDPEASWEELLPVNVVAVHEIATAAVAVGVSRLVLAGSLHSVSGYPMERQVRSVDVVRPGNLYGATKAWAEAVGAWVGATSSTSVVALRLGYFCQEAPSGDDRTDSDRAAWLSPADCVELVRAAVEGPVEGFSIVNGISANRHRKGEYGAAEIALGYRPTDDAWTVVECKL